MATTRFANPNCCRYCAVICVSYLAASIADACAYTMFRSAGDALACRLRRRVLRCTMHRDLNELAQVPVLAVRRRSF